jgi:hypothetical protein
MPSNEDSTVFLSDQVARELLARATVLDAAQRDSVSLARLRDAAQEAGIGVDALDRAVAELVERSENRERAPLWVRRKLFGVVDRAGAMVFYWLFVLMTLGIPVYLLVAPGRATFGQRLISAIAFGIITTYMTWSTARAIRWADRHGWDKLS